MKNKLITGRYKGYEVCYANKGQIFPRDGWYLTKGDDVIYIEDAIAQTREETIGEVKNEIRFNEEMENQGEFERGRIHGMKRILYILNKLKK